MRLCVIWSFSQEQFKSSVPSHIATFFNEDNVKTAAEAARLADEYVLTVGSSYFLVSC